MILGIDVGNTHITFGCIEGDKIINPVLRIPTDRKETEFGYAVKIKEILDLLNIDIKGLKGAVISSVVPSVTDMLSRAVKLMSGMNSLIVGPGIKTGIKIAIDDPGTLAADLITTAVGAASFYKLPCLIIDMGTATTFTIVDEKSTYRGGAIYPGLGTSLNALTMGTSLLPAIEVKAPKHAIATNTVESMRSGIIYGTAGAIDGIISAFETEFGSFETIVCTGGMGHIIKPYCKHDLKMDEEILLKGLGIIWNKNS
jgi:type III pantothenate kinase